VLAGEVKVAYRPEAFRGSPIIEPESLIDRLDLEKIFGRNAPIYVDLGCGDGSFICALAERLPARNFLGIERLLGRIRSTARKAATVGNVRLLRMENSYAVRYLLPAGSVETFYLLFPDPWPKRRHWRRRTVTGEFLRAISQALAENGRFILATDHLGYFEKIEEIARANPDFTVAPSGAADSFDLRSHDGGQARQVLPSTKFERQFRAQGTAIHWLELRKVSPVR
jgi:tRNA (guanine-N7-)-methyltransferase